MAHGLPQPEAQNKVTEDALKLDPTHIWYVDDDMALPKETLSHMLLTDSEIVVADYPIDRNKHSVCYKNGIFQYAGLGCVLARRSVFDKLAAPYFHKGLHYIWEGDHFYTQPAPPSDPQSYLDVDFFQRLLKTGVEPAVIKSTVGQYWAERYAGTKFQQDSVQTWRFE
jgi:hypothetical protein